MVLNPLPDPQPNSLPNYNLQTVIYVRELRSLYDDFLCVSSNGEVLNHNNLNNLVNLNLPNLFIFINNILLHVETVKKKHIMKWIIMRKYCHYKTSHPEYRF